MNVLSDFLKTTSVTIDFTSNKSSSKGKYVVKRNGSTDTGVVQ